jgi:peptidoglycan/LPS O-acetylase OafA/YrhL
MAEPWRRIAGLDGVRGIAILLVFLDHRWPGANAFYLGGYGVHIFFVLSGFLIVSLLHRDQHDIAEGRNAIAPAWRDFMIRRAARILPLYYLLLLALGLYAWAQPIDTFPLWQVAIYGLFLSNFHMIALGHWGPVGQSWSLAIEEQFYLLAAPTLLAVPPRYARPVCIVVAVAGTLWYFALILMGAGSMAIGLDSLSNFGLIAMGGAMALRPQASSARTGTIAQPLLLAGLLLLPFIPGAAVNPVIRQIGQPLIAAWLLVELRDNPETRLVRLLEARWLVGLGSISYGLYLLHQSVTPVLLRSLTFGWLDMTEWTPAAQFLPLFTLSIAAAAGSWHWLERPIIRHARRALTGRSPEPALVASPA